MAAMSDTIIVTGVIDLDPAKRDDAIAAALVVMEATRAEEGSEAYAFTADLADPGRLHLVKQWASAEALDAHIKSAHLAEFMARIGQYGVTGASAMKWEGATGSKLA
jgi:quinol monooxygenase YgiN